MGALAGTQPAQQRLDPPTLLQNNGTSAPTRVGACDQWPLPKKNGATDLVDLSVLGIEIGRQQTAPHGLPGFDGACHHRVTQSTWFGNM
jgi:hypothetical protein